ncbi:MAG: hypothetical protein DI630_26765 [Gordonia sp. (in: high G+C Gram-positive bacteria)]|nr:MAG: hypothetical protein DI630_26765 [Gordonia sp. (in: high G+C Gram-positive bacteria)]
MYIRKVGEKLFAVHYPGTGHDGSHPIGESDEHKRQKEYFARAAVGAGFAVELEKSTGNGTRPDVTVIGTGSTRIGGEVQHSHLSEGAAKSRTTKTIKAGYTPMWVNDKGLEKQPWLYLVPSVTINRLNWDVELPVPGSAFAIGVVKVSALMCTSSNFDYCPEGKRLPCGNFHVSLRDPWRGLTLDDLIGMSAASQVVPISCASYRPDGSGRMNVRWVSSADATKAAELYGYDVLTTSRKAPTVREARKLAADQKRACASPQHSTKGPGKSRTRLYIPALGPPCDVCGGAVTGKQGTRHLSCQREADLTGLGLIGE